jgi:hypothetical protein
LLARSRFFLNDYLPTEFTDKSQIWPAKVKKADVMIRHKYAAV